MAAVSKSSAGRTIYYGWWIVLCCGFLQFFGAGLFFYGLGTFFLPLVAEFGWSRAATSVAFSLYRLEGGVVAPLVGFVFDRIGPRKLGLFGVVLLGVGFLALNQVGSLAGFIVVVLLMSTGYSCAFTANTMATVAKWFVRLRGSALGLVMAGSGLGGLLVPVLAYVIETHGWRAAALVVGATIVVAGIPMVMVLRSSPESCGLLPDGEKPAGLGAARKGLKLLPRADLSAVKDGSEIEFGTREALKERSFWLLVIGTSLASMAQAALVVHAIPHVVSLGISQTLAASVVGAMSVVSVAGRLGFGFLMDRFPKRWIGAVVYAFQAAGLVVLAVVSEPWQLFLFIALFAPGYGGAYPLRPSLQAEYFGRRSFGAIQGIILGCNAVAGMISPVATGWVYDVTGSYRLAMWGLAAVVLIAIPAIVAMPRPRVNSHRLEAAEAVGR